MNILHKKRMLLFWSAIMFVFVLCFSKVCPAEEATTTFPVELTGDQLYEQGFDLCNQGKHQEAISYFKEAAKRKTESISGMIALSPPLAKILADKFPDEFRLYEKLDFWKAIDRLEETLFRNNKNYYAWYFLGLNYLKTQKWEKADDSLLIAKIYGDESLSKVAYSLLLTIPQYKAELEKQVSQEIKQWRIEQERLKELARQEEERIRLAQVEAERVKKEEMSNYLAALSQERRSLFTEIAKYFMGDENELENSFNIARQNENMSDEELRASLTELQQSVQVTAEKNAKDYTPQEQITGIEQ